MRRILATSSPRPTSPRPGISLVATRCLLIAVTSTSPHTSVAQSVVIRSSPMEDIPRRYRTCAVVGNGPGLKMGGHKLGSIIDKHDAVIKVQPGAPPEEQCVSSFCQIP